MNDLYDNNKIYTVDQLVNSKVDTEITYDTLSIYQLVNDTYLATHNVLDDYKKEIFSVAKNVLLYDDEYSKYYQSPQLLAYDLYGSTEMDYIILFLNNMADMKDFTKKNIKLLSPDNLTEILTSIYQTDKAVLTKFKL